MAVKDMISLEDFIKKNPSGLAARAFNLAKEAHRGQKRKSGEIYFNHALATARMLLNWRLDEKTVAAGLLHDVVEDTDISLKEIEKQFGEEIAFLVNGVTKLGRIKYRGLEAKAENTRKLILALSEDLRVIFIKLADRLHNMKTLAALPPIKQKRIALETFEIYAPLAYRLGMQNLSGELEDLAFPYIYPQEHKWLKENVKEEYEKRQRYLEKIKPQLEKIFHEGKIKPLFIDFRAKRYASLYKKLLRYDMDVEKIYDLVAFRIIVNTIEECYSALGLTHHFWTPLPGRIKDYIAMPKPNGYRSLHTTVLGPEGKIIEFQIKTDQMHQENENGIAAHWHYEQTKESGQYQKWQAVRAKTEEILWVQQLRGWQEKFQNPDRSEEFIKSMKIDFFKDRIFVITPKGDVIDLPVGATPVDFAYQIHSEIGDNCVGAKVNGQIVPLDYQLHSGNAVEILTQKNKKPSESWLKFIKTSIARDRIKAALKQRTKISAFKPAKTEFKLTLKDRLGLLKDITAVISRSHINIANISTVPKKGGAFLINKIQCEIADQEKIAKLIFKLKKIKEVKEISYKIF